MPQKNKPRKSKKIPGIEIPDHNNNNNNNGPSSILIIVIATVVQHPYCASTDIPELLSIFARTTKTRTALVLPQEETVLASPVRLLSPVLPHKPITKTP